MDEHQQMRDPRFREALADLMARAETLGDPVQFMVIGMDRTLKTRPPSVDVFGPYDGPTALIEAQRLREEYDRSELADVEVHIGGYLGERED